MFVALISIESYLQTNSIITECGGKLGEEGNVILFIAPLFCYYITTYTQHPQQLLQIRFPPQNIYFSGRAILFNTVVSLVFVLRYLMTFLRNVGLAHKLPLDHNIYFQKVVGWIIFVQAWLHTIAHLINFGE